MRSVSGMARGPERRPLEAKGTPPKLSWEVTPPMVEMWLCALVPRRAGAVVEGGGDAEVTVAVLDVGE